MTMGLTKIPGIDISIPDAVPTPGPGKHLGTTAIASSRQSLQSTIPGKTLNGGANPGFLVLAYSGDGNTMP
jgi:hypothetical protein